MLAGFLCALAAVVSAESPVSIVSTSDAAGQIYNWTVTNQTASPIVGVEFPQYRAALFHAPSGWAVVLNSTSSTFGDKRLTVSTAAAQSPAQGIAPGGSAQFRMQTASAGVRRGTGQAGVRFADGRVAIIDNVELPQREPWGDRYLSLIGLGIVLGAFVFIQTMRRGAKGRRSHD
jgi:hypothetical protein